MKTSSLDILEKAQLPLSQAKAILAVVEAELESNLGTLVTREVLRDEIRRENRWVYDEFKSVRDELHRLEVKIESVHASTNRWVLTCILGQTAFLSGAFYFALTHIHR